MNKEKQDYLFKTYPKAFCEVPKEGPNYGPKVFTPIGQRGIECGDGWYEIIKNLAANFEKLDTSFVQIKEKFGTLRVYYAALVLEEHMLEEELIAPHRCLYAVRARFRRTLVCDAESLSARTCENCAAPAEIRDDLSWIQTLCETCYKNAKEKNA